MCFRDTDTLEDTISHKLFPFFTMGMKALSHHVRHMFEDELQRKWRDWERKPFGIILQGGDLVLFSDEGQLNGDDGGARSMGKEHGLVGEQENAAKVLLESCTNVRAVVPPTPKVWPRSEWEQVFPFSSSIRTRAPPEILFSFPADGRHGLRTRHQENICKVPLGRDQQEEEER